MLTTLHVLKVSFRLIKDSALVASCLNFIEFSQ